ncbi:MAG TPA: FAD-binding oxidoreductase [Methylomirabilota bacterium]|nr:FAD-binding oxidoreductase [Methylomirabilota bacterium]
MAVSAPALESALADIVGREHVLAGRAALATAAVDGLEPRWLVQPGTAEEVSRLLAVAGAEGLAVSPRGGGAAAGLGNPPKRLDLVLDLARLNALIDYVPEDMVVTVGAGMTLGTLAGHLGKKGQMLALDPAGGGRRTVGGVLATAASGPLRFRYGTGRDLLLGVRFVQADGTLTWGGARVVKSVTGYDVPKLLVGSLGTLGVIVEAVLRLHPLPPARATFAVGFDSPERAQALLGAVLDSPLEPDRVAVLNAPARRALEGPAVPALLVSFGSVEDAIRSQGETLGGIAATLHCRAERVSDPWDALERCLGGPVTLRLGCEIRRVMHWLGEVERAADRLSVPVSVAGEAGDGVLHIALGDGAAERPVVSELVAPLRQGLGAEGGSLVVTQMPVALKAECDVWGPIAPDSLTIMKRIKLEFDPRGILNPGRFLGGI